MRSGKTNELLNGASWARAGGRLDPIGDVNGDGLVDGVYLGKKVVVMLSERSEDEDLARPRPFPQMRPPSLEDLWPGVLLGKDGEKLRPVRAAPAGDLDGDGHNDLLIVLAGEKSEAVLGVSWKKRGAPLMRMERMSPDEWFSEEPALGYVTLGGIDLDGNGCDDIVLGNPSVIRDGQVVAAPGVADKSIKQVKWPAFQGAYWHVNLAGNVAMFGVSLAAFDDCDADGIPDILVGNSDWFWAGTVYRGNSLRLLSGRTGETLWAVSEDQYQELGG